MASLIRGFFKGKMNKDADDRLLPEGEYRDALNVEVGTSSGSNLGVAQNILGNTLSADLTDLVSGASITNARCIGAVSVPQENKIYWFITSDDTDGIFEFDISTNTSFRVCQSDKNGNNSLNFNVDYLITGLNYIKIRSGDKFLYFTDGLNPPRKINIDRVKTYDVDDERLLVDINVIVRPPLYAPAVVPSEVEDDTEQNNLLEKFIQVSYRYKYIDGEWSSLSPFSPDIFQPNGTNPDYNVGYIADMVNRFNSFEVFFNTGSSFVTDIQIVYSDSRALNVYIIDTLNKQNNSWGDNETQSIVFKHNKIYSILPNVQLERLFDNVPLLAKAQEFSGSRLMYGNYTQFFNINENLIDFTLEVKSQVLTTEEYLPTLKSGRNYEVALLYLDEFGRMSTAISKYDSNAFIKYSDSDKANSIELTINHTPPDFATNFRLALKQDRDDYYNIYPIAYYSDDTYRWFLINDSDVDKIDVGKYLILKTSKNVIYDGDKYKILEKNYKSSDFLGENEKSGLYFKVKADANEFDGSDIFFLEGVGAGVAGTSWKGAFGNNSSVPILGFSQEAVSTIFYGEGDDNLTVTPNLVTINQISTDALLTNTLYGDKRIVVELYLDGVDLKFRYKNVRAEALYSGFYSDNFGSGFLVSDYFASPKEIKEITETTNLGVSIQFDSGATYNPGDYWVINLKPIYPSYKSIGEGGVTLTPTELEGANYYNYGLWLEGYRPATAIISGYGEIKQNTIIRISIRQTAVQSEVTHEWVSDANYANLEEWFYESGAYQDFSVFAEDEDYGYKNVVFRKALVGKYDLSTDDIAGKDNSILNSSGEMCMFIFGYKGDTSLTGNQRTFIDVDYSFYYLESIIVFETDPLEADVDIYHELSHTYNIENNKHIVGWGYDDWEFASGLTRLTQLGDNRNPHYFNVGDSIYVRHSNTGRIPEGYYDVLNVEDRYSVIIDLAFPGSGAAEPGYIYFNDTDINQIGLNPAKITLNHKNINNNIFNAFTFGNGIESNRIKDDFNEATVKLSKRVTTVIEDYRQENREHSICYSQPFSIETEGNRYNEFILSTINYKNLNIEFGSIQKLFSKDTNLYVFQEDKISTLLVNKNLISDSVGGGEIVASQNVLGTQIPNIGEYGISTNPESFAQWDNYLWCIDKNRGAIVQITGNQSIDVSDYDMKDYFRDLLQDNDDDPIVSLIGGYDVHTHQYIVAKKTQEEIIA